MAQEATFAGGLSSFDLDVQDKAFQFLTSVDFNLLPTKFSAVIDKHLALNGKLNNNKH